jgi:hypothetical protein
MTEKKRGRPRRTEEVVQPVEAVEAVQTVEPVEIVEIVEVPIIKAALYKSMRKGRLGLGDLVFEPEQVKELTDEQIQSAPVARAIETGILKKQ